MTQLTVNMYQVHEIGLFGLSKGQMREPYVLKNLYWYNKAGEWLGYGDISVQDLESIAEGLQEGEIFLMLPESAFLRFNGNDTSAPGPDFVGQEAILVVVPKYVCVVDHYLRQEDGADCQLLKDRSSGRLLEAKYMSDDHLLDLLAA